MEPFFPFGCLKRCREGAVGNLNATGVRERREAFSGSLAPLNLPAFLIMVFIGLKGAMAANIIGNNLVEYV